MTDELTAEIHPTALVDPQAVLGDGVVVGAFCRIEGPVKIGARTKLHPHVTVVGRVELGEDCVLHPFVCLGAPPQDPRFGDAPTAIIIGDRTVMREQATAHPGVKSANGATRIGSDCLLMVAAHVGHDSVVGDHVVFANHASLGGACSVGDHVVLGGFAAIHPGVRIGRHSFIGGGAMVSGDLVPYASAYGAPATLSGVNLTGLKARDYDRAIIRDLRAACRLLTARDAALAERLDDIAQMFPDRAEVVELVDFARAPSPRSLCLT
ncbi:MAG: acyl-ACP--UDP-N-acetylglucosamine O-acyltransferase [Maricaulaceae bacterium]|jgi:UDP-N-acetylglucosamine acyltransferase